MHWSSIKYLFLLFIFFHSLPLSFFLFLSLTSTFPPPSLPVALPRLIALPLFSSSYTCHPSPLFFPLILSTLSPHFRLLFLPRFFHFFVCLFIFATPTSNQRQREFPVSRCSSGSPEFMLGSFLGAWHGIFDNNIGCKRII